MRKLVAATLVAAAATLAFLPVARADTITPAASAQLDMDAIHRAYFQMPAGAPAQALSWFEEEVNRYNHGAEFVSVAAQQAWLSGQPVTVVSGYIDRDGVPGLNPATDQVLFRFVQTAPLSASGLSYEFVDGSGVVYYRGIRALPATAYYRAYYLGIGATTPFINYYTPYSRLAWLRTWRAGYRLTPVYRTWYRGYLARPAYAVRIASLRRTYGVSVGLPRISFNARVGYGARIGHGARIGYRPAARTTTTTVRTTVRPANHGRAVISKTVTRTTTVARASGHSHHGRF